MHLIALENHQKSFNNASQYEEYSVNLQRIFINSPNVQIWHHAERETILKCARRIKPDNIFVKEDLSPATLEKRESQRPKMEAAKRAGKIAYFVLDKLVIRDRPNVENS